MEKMISYFNFWLKLHPEDTTVREFRACAYIELGLMESALSDADILLDNSPNDSRIWCLKAQTLIRRVKQLKTTLGD